MAVNPLGFNWIEISGLIELRRLESTESKQLKNGLNRIEQNWNEIEVNWIQLQPYELVKYWMNVKCSRRAAV